QSQEVAELLRPEPLPDGTGPEERLILCGLSWQRYLDLDKALGDDRPGPRFYYSDGNLEIMTTSNEHERVKTWIGDLLTIHFDVIDCEIMPRGQATMRLALKQAGAEPDESWCLGEEKEFPDLVLEIALTSGGVNKLELYRRFQIPEVWLWRKNALEIYALRRDGSSYERITQNRLLPKLDVVLLQRCVGIASWREARRAFRAGLESGN
ncbi:MAG: Uma2 family endonuclease, partial [Verrucomicrobiales bacterium]|nr:Uma2 family endonuclease [Verrucomicrobiales bacterium]